MSSNRLIYDEGAYKVNLNQSVGSYAYILDPVKYENCNNCIQQETGNFTINQWVGLRDDNCAVNSYEKESLGPGNYVLSNFHSCECGAPGAREVAAQNPQMQVSDGYGWVSNGGCKVDDDSNVRLGCRLTNPRIINQLFTRPYLSIPYMGKGCYQPNNESNLIFGEDTGEKRSCNVLAGVTIDNFYTPMIGCLRENIQNPKNLIEETYGWIRGGESTRKNLKDIDYKRVCLPVIKKRTPN